MGADSKNHPNLMHDISSRNENNHHTPTLEALAYNEKEVSNFLHQPLSVSTSKENIQRPQRMQRHQRRQQLLDVAAEVFVKNGYHQTSMDDIAIQAGISKPVLYQHFPGKLELYLAVLTLHINTLAISIRQALKSTNNEQTMVTAAVEAFFNYANQQGQAYKLIFQSDVSEKSVKQKISGAIEDCIDIVFDTISQDHKLNTMQARMVAVALVGLSQVNAQYWIDSHKQITKDEAIKITSSMAWGAYTQVRAIGDH